MAFSNVNINDLIKSYDAYDNPILKDAQGNVYNPVYGGEMNTLQSLNRVSDMNGVPLTQYFDANGNFIYGNENKNYGTGTNGIARDYDINGNMTERAFVNDPWKDIKEAGLFLGSAALGANALGAALGQASIFGAGAGAGAGATGLTAEQLATMNALGGTEVAGGLTAAEAATAGLGGGVTGAGAGLLGATGLTTGQIANLVKAGVGLVGAGGATNLVTGGGGGGTNTGGGVYQSPTQGVPTNSGDYYSQLQQYYTGYMPNAARDVVSPLKDWYSTTYGGAPVSGAAEGNTVANTGTTNTNAGLFNTGGIKTGVTTNTAAKAPTYTSADINAWFRNNPGASDAQVVAAMKQFGISTKQISDATGISLKEIDTRYNNVLNPVTKTQTSTVTANPTYTSADINNWLMSNPGASDVTVAETMNQFGITPAQMSAATGIDLGEITQRYNAATGAAASTVNTVQQPQYSSTDINNWLMSNPNSSDATVVSAMQQFGITPAQMAAATGIGLDEITQRYNAVLGQ
jgi:hypothetical protein